MILIKHLRLDGKQLVVGGALALLAAAAEAGPTRFTALNSHG
jgi:hypothetical protein